MTHWNRFLVGTLITIVPEPAIEVAEAVLNVELEVPPGSYRVSGSKLSYHLRQI